ncbi:LysM peptidoglycan-binding domain-containing protein [Lysinibacillus sp. BW-2-10]|uniref:LysM peptidoglycan-binding domain-containing protein n=1 Tax=Lysinibacillus sp. BW-2-10 TaxID=2590030 RepID=UPI00117DEB2F|nr:LysM peptidoglycan-binding domain-containing protein [Lysinibacillus sp. BW-2-10]TSI11025.1 LysM peptidoglycan-binding domain-containing protein [Lysinibacillus sp. BW-2-10]
MLIHVVRPGETLNFLASRYNVNVNDIQQVNQLPNPNQLLNGQAIVIPSPGSTHTVQVGDTLWSIAQQYGVTINALIRANRITNPNQLTIGTTLYIPPLLHTVLPGESLWQIANYYQTSIEAILTLNRIQNSNYIYSGTPLLIPRPKPLIEVNAYTYQKDEEAAQSVSEIGHLLTYLSPFAYIIKQDGTLQPFADDSMLSSGKSKQVVPMLSITNLSVTDVGTNLAHEVLSNPSTREKLLSNVLEIMKRKGYKGLNIDFEYVEPQDRENYNAFIQEAVNRLHQQGYFVSTAVAPKTSGTQEGLLYTAHDYEAHGRIADFVVLMTYEWGWRGASPQAISPIHQMRRVVEYALSVMPANKIYLGFQIYARDWKLPHVKGAIAETFSPQEAIRRATKYNAAIQYDETAQSPYFRYVDEQGQNHEVWFEDARSAQAKFNLIKQYHLRGVSYWALGYPYPQNWALLNDTFDIKKLV